MEKITEKFARALLEDLLFCKSSRANSRLSSEEINATIKHWKKNGKVEKNRFDEYSIAAQRRIEIAEKEFGTHSMYSNILKEVFQGAVSIIHDLQKEIAELKK